MGYGEVTDPRMAIQLSMMESVDSQILHTEKRLADLREAKALLEKNPDIERLVSLLGNGLLNRS